MGTRLHNWMGANHGITGLQDSNCMGAHPSPKGGVVQSCTVLVLVLAHPLWMGTHHSHKGWSVGQTM
eukprot:3057646-Karenia_brevis.AAC.1